MEAEERPTKLRKLSHGENAEQPPQYEPLIEAWPRKIVDHQEQRQKNEVVECANDTDANSTPKDYPQDPNSAKSTPEPAAPLLPTSPLTHQPALSKTQLKKLRKKQDWEASRSDRKLIRKQKSQEKKARKRAARDAGTENRAPTIASPPHLETGHQTSSRPSLRPSSGVSKHVSSTVLPITLIIDCSFDTLMHDRERISLASQVTRSYSDNSRAPFRAHLVISSFGGELRNRFDTVLNRHHRNWKGVRVLEEDFVEAAAQAKGWMGSETRGGKLLAGAFALEAQGSSVAELEGRGEVVYLTSDSENTLDRLKPYSTYIIGGLVDKNRHKGVCYKSACDRGVMTAKLPIGDYMDMQSRYVLATNHVVEIMVRWLECGDWGQAFLKVMPKRKGAKLKQESVMNDGGNTEGGGGGGGGGGGEPGIAGDEDGEQQEIGEIGYEGGGN